VEVDALFDLHIRYVIEGIARDLALERAASTTSATRGRNRR
jgi:hypothetical protein